MISLAMVSVGLVRVLGSSTELGQESEKEWNLVGESIRVSVSPSSAAMGWMICISIHISPCTGI